MVQHINQIQVSKQSETTEVSEKPVVVGGYTKYPFNPSHKLLQSNQNLIRIVIVPTTTWKEKPT